MNPASSWSAVVRSGRDHDGLSRGRSESSLDTEMHVVAFLFVVTWTASLSEAYDFASACVRPYRSNRARAEPTAPCDLTKHAYCTTPGSNYPWQAIRRFVRENQGLMRRMYGEERHISVLKAELDNYIEDDDDTEDNDDFADDIAKTKLMYSKRGHGRAMKDKPHFRPIQNSDKNKKVENDSLKVKPLELSGNSTKLNKIDSGNKTNVTNNQTMHDKGISYKTQLESIAHIEINNLEPDVITLDAVIKQSIETNSVYPNKPNNSKTDPETATKNITVSDKNLTTPVSTEKLGVNNSEVTMEKIDDATTISDKDGWKAVNPIGGASTLPPSALFSEHEKGKLDRVDTKINDKKDEPSMKPPLFQEKRPSVIKLRGANACETKEELLAPFWANNTRGEKLVLVNMYPYEQYIHLETCVHEKKQMYCREGCRCEQHYRLHRLLAFDPHNPCRGIFSDWFKFPACCVCRCYDVPLEFRARSPRVLHPQYGDDVKRIIYEDVARDWYMMTAYGDDEDDDLV